MVARRHLHSLLVLLACCPADAAAVRGTASAHARAIIAKLKQRPLMFFVAKGGPNACGPHCSTWIAADGMIDPDAAPRFRAFLDQPGRRGLPVFFSSPGGSTRQAVAIGLMLREYRMRAGVARTVPDSCRAMGEACRRIAQSKPEHAARLVTAGARCVSGCVYALLGASVRQVAHDAEIGIHSVRYVGALRGRASRSPPSSDIVYDGLRTYVAEMGADPSLIDVAAKISPDRMHWLSRAEIERFGVETHGYYETRWTAHREITERFVVLKSWTREGRNGAYYTTVMRMGCSNSVGYLLTYRSELPSEASDGIQVRLATAGDGLRLTRLPAETDGAVWYAAIERDTMQRTAMGRSLAISESRGAAETRTFELSTAGLSDALGRLRQHCDERGDVVVPEARRDN
jgi:hypothetical protein